MFQTLTERPLPTIYTTDARFEADGRPDKLLLSTGLYCDAEGRCPVPEFIKEAEARVLASEQTKAYLLWGGDGAFNAALEAFVLGAEHPARVSGKTRTLQTPGSTAALRLVAELMARHAPGKACWVSQPGWGSHTQICLDVGVPVKTYPYLRADGLAVDLDAVVGALEGANAGDAVVFQAANHLPTGVDPSAEQWAVLADLCARRGLVPVLDAAFLGFGAPFEQEFAGLRAFFDVVQGGGFVTTSFGKAFGLYRERVGALTIVGPCAQRAQALWTHALHAVRTIYSSPPSHGAAVARTVLADPDLRAGLESRTAQIRARLGLMRRLIAERAQAAGLGARFARIQHERGLFTKTGMDEGQVAALHDRFAIHMNSRAVLNVSALPQASVERFIDAMAHVVADSEG